MLWGLNEWKELVGCLLSVVCYQFEKVVGFRIETKMLSVVGYLLSVEKKQAVTDILG